MVTCLPGVSCILHSIHIMWRFDHIVFHIHKSGRNNNPLPANINTKSTVCQSSMFRWLWCGEILGIITLDMDDQVIPVFYIHQWAETQSHQIDLLLNAAWLTGFLSTQMSRRKKREAKKVTEPLVVQSMPQHSHRSFLTEHERASHYSRAKATAFVILGLKSKLLKSVCCHHVTRQWH